MSGTGSGEHVWDLFVSYNWKDESDVVVVTDALERRGLRVFLDRSCLTPGKPWPVELAKNLKASRAVAVFVGPHGMGPWQNRETFLAIDRQNGDPDFRVIPVLLRDCDPALGLLGPNTWIDLRDGVTDPEKLDALANAVLGEARVEERPTSKVCPYRGLLPFREEDASYFFGRETYTRRLVQAVERQPLVAVIGASGSGKSSVVRAGLVPELRRQGWEIATFVVGDRPFRNLAAALMPLLEPGLSETDRFAEIATLAAQMHGDTTGIRDVAERLLEKLPGTKRLLLVADQWEELYTLTTDPDEREWFLRQTLKATSVKGAPLTVVLTLRADFYGQALENRSLADRLHVGSVPIGLMNASELREVVVRPAERVGLVFQPGLDHRILNAVEKEPGSLPLLEFVLTRLWEHRSGGALVHEAYDRMGGLHGALAKRADDVFEGLGAEQQRVARRVFLDLVRTDEERATRRRANFGELGEEAIPMVRELASARLLVTGREGDTGMETAELAHETLIRNWPRLEEWIHADREFLLWRQRLRSARSYWLRQDKNDGALLGGIPLAEARNRLAQRGSELTLEEKSFIKTSDRIERARNTVARLYRTVLALLVAGVGVLGAGFLSEKSYAMVAGIDRQLTFADTAKTGLSFLSTLLVSSLSIFFLVVLVFTVGLALYRAGGSRLLERLSSAEATPWSQRSGLLLAAQSVTLLLLLVTVLLLLDAVPLGLDSFPVGDDLARRQKLYDQLSFIALAAVLSVILLERWRRRLVRDSEEAGSFSDSLSFLLAVGIYVALVVDLSVFAIGFGILIRPGLGV